MIYEKEHLNVTFVVMFDNRRASHVHVMSKPLAITVTLLAYILQEVR